MTYKLGKTPAVKNSIPLRFRDYLKLSNLPIPPLMCTDSVELADDNTFNNTKYGDCVCAGAGHETLLWNRLAEKQIDLTTTNVLTMYSELTGFKADDPSTDQGTDIVAAAKWRKDHGIMDSSGLTHKVQAYVAVTPGNIEEVKQAIYLFGAMGIGWELPESALDQAANGAPWTVIDQSPIAGGHYTAAIGYDSQYLYIITWGQVVKVAWDFFSKYNDEGIAYFSEEDLENGKTKEGFNVDQLIKDLNQL